MTMQTVVDILLLTSVTVYVVDISGFVLSVKRGLWRIVFGRGVPFRFYRLKPLDCSQCLSFWLSFVYAYSEHKLLYALSIATSAAISSLYISLLLSALCYNHLTQND